MSHHELHRYWQVWWREVNQRRNAGTFARTPELQLLSQVCVCVCVSVCPSVCLSACLILFVWLSVCQFVCCCVCFACMPTVLTVLIYVKWCWQLLVGDDKAFQELKERYRASCPHWYHMMVGKLLFSYPTIISSDYELIHVAEVTETIDAIPLK